MSYKDYLVYDKYGNRSLNMVLCQDMYEFKSPRIGMSFMIAFDHSSFNPVLKQLIDDKNDGCVYIIGLRDIEEYVKFDYNWNHVLNWISFETNLYLGREYMKHRYSVEEEPISVFDRLHPRWDKKLREDAVKHFDNCKKAAREAVRCMGMFDS